VFEQCGGQRRETDLPALLAGASARPGGLTVVDDVAAMFDELAELERAKREIAAAQAEVTAAIVRSQGGGPDVAAQVALARGESPRRGGQLVGMATALVEEMPNTLAALRSGRTSEWGATCLVRETAVLQRADRVEVDRRMAGQLATAGVSEAQLARTAKGIAHELDAAAAVKRAARAEGDRRVSIRPAPDTMVYVGALLPVAEGVAAFAALGRQADAAVATGDPRSRGQLMADTFVARLTGRDPLTEPVPVHVSLVMTDTTLLDRGTASAMVRGAKQPPVPVPAGLARKLAARAGRAGQAWVRRLYTSPDRTQLVAADSRARLFPAALAELVALADQTCRTPYCDAPVRHTDHVHPHAEGGPTSLENAQGLCERCNHTKESPGWTARAGPGRAVTTTTPTGHTYRSVPPPVLPSALSPPGPVHELEPADQLAPADELEADEFKAADDSPPGARPAPGAGATPAGVDPVRDVVVEIFFGQRWHRRPA